MTIVSVISAVTMRLKGYTCIRHVFGLVFLQIVVSFAQNVNIQQLGKDLQIKYTVIEHPATPAFDYVGRISIGNGGQSIIPAEGWSIFFCHKSIIEPIAYNYVQKRYPDGFVLRGGSFILQHIKGCMFELKPNTGFNSTYKAMKPGETIEIPFMADQTAISKYDMYPNWYVADSRNNTSVIESTKSNDLSFVTPFTTLTSTMRSPADMLPLTPWSRFIEPETSPATPANGCMVPTPKSTFQTKKGNVKVDSSWKVYFDWSKKNQFPKIQAIVSELEKGFGIQVNPKPKNQKKLIGLYINRKPNMKEQPMNHTIRVENDRIGIFAHTQEALYHGVQTLLGMRKSDGSVPHITIQDEPRFPYRGLRLDVASNFFNKSTVIKILDAMKMYKMNKLQLELSNNEGWRIEIPDYPELAKIGGRRCHDMSEETCLFTQLGTEPQAEPQYYTAADYQEIIKEAGKRFIEVVPSINMAGKARAAIVAMEAHSKAANKPEHRLQDPVLSGYYSPDHLNYAHIAAYENPQVSFDPRFIPTRYPNTGINPCLPFTLEFFETVLKTIQDYHTRAGIPLKKIDIGGEDTTYGAWYASSPACQAKIQNENRTNEIDKEIYLKVLYTTDVENVTSSYGVGLGALDDFYVAFPSNLDIERTGPRVPFNPKRFNAPNTMHAVTTHNYKAYAARPTALANVGYKVVQSPDDYFSFDHANEPNANDLGEHIAMRFIHDFRVFSFLPNKLCCNYNPDPLLHQPMSPNGCLPESHPYCLILNDNAVNNLIGLQAKISTQNIRTEEDLFSLLFPRLVVFAERAWHKASWEDSYQPPAAFNPQMQQMQNTASMDIAAQQKDWSEFRHCLSTSEFDKLEKINVGYRVPPPGVRISVANTTTTGSTKYQRVLLSSVQYPEYFTVQIKINGTWMDMPAVADFDSLENETVIELRSRNKANTRFSRIVTIKTQEYKAIGLQLEAEILAREAQAKNQVDANIQNTLRSAGNPRINPQPAVQSNTRSSLRESTTGGVTTGNTRSTSSRIANSVRG